MTTKRCGSCGRGMSRQLTTGPFSWKDFPAVYLNEPVELFKCNFCGERGLSPSDAKTLDEMIQKNVISYTGGGINLILEREGCRQFELAERLGVTKTHLSALKSGDKNISFQTFNFLKVMALDSNAFHLADPKIDCRCLLLSSEALSEHAVTTNPEDFSYKAYVAVPWQNANFLTMEQPTSGGAASSNVLEPRAKKRASG